MRQYYSEDDKKSFLPNTAYNSYKPFYDSELELSVFHLLDIQNVDDQLPSRIIKREMIFLQARKKLFRPQFSGPNNSSLNNTAISINVVGLKLQAYATRPNGGLGIHWNLHLCVAENYMFLFLCV